mmetsp:Transcript_17518/g.17269  ORF Transcript_17518/g.17269 Transcript_17518/m.17269 type:complete len:82 (+) Transcript_17518:228-473(+)
MISYNSPHEGFRPQVRHNCTFANCTKSFKTVEARDGHVRYHYKSRPYECRMCSKSYTQKGNLKKHYLTHLTPSVDVRKVYQ